MNGRKAKQARRILKQLGGEDKVEVDTIIANWPEPAPLPPPGKKECRRRLAQIREGRLKGDEKFISVDTRYAAAGLYGASVV